MLIPLICFVFDCFFSSLWPVFFRIITGELSFGLLIRELKCCPPVPRHADELKTRRVHGRFRLGSSAFAYQISGQFDSVSSRFRPESGAFGTLQLGFPSLPARFQLLRDTSDRFSSASVPIRNFPGLILAFIVAS